MHATETSTTEKNGKISSTNSFKSYQQNSYNCPYPTMVKIIT